MNSLQTLSRRYTLSPTNTDPRIFTYSDETPAASFHHFLTLAKDEQMLLCTSFKVGDDQLAQTVLREAKSFVSTVELTKPLTIIPSAKLGPFDAFAMLSHEAHSLYETIDENVFRATVVVFPVYKCELDGTESSDLIRMIRRDLLPTLQWDREPSPKIHASFVNGKTGVRSVSKKLKLASLPEIISILKQIEGCQNSWVEMRNWLGETLKIEFVNDYQWRLDSGTAGNLSALDKVVSFVQSFCVQGAGNSDLGMK